jgi:hypothetical protein
MVTVRILPYQGKIPIVELGIEPGTHIEMLSFCSILFHWHMQNTTIRSCSKELLPFLPEKCHHGA